MYMAEYAQKTCRSDLRIATRRESEFPPTMHMSVNAQNFTHPLYKQGASVLGVVSFCILLIVYFVDRVEQSETRPTDKVSELTFVE